MAAQSKTNRAWIFWVASIIAIALWAANWFWVVRNFKPPEESGQFGDMFGAVNALFTALGFAGLIYTVLLQREQLALQQKEIVESGIAQEKLVQRQIDAQGDLLSRQLASQESLSAKQQTHELKLEETRQAFEKGVEQLRKDREAEAKQLFEHNLLSAVRRELEALKQIYNLGIGADLAKVEPGGMLMTRLGLTQDWFTIYNTNSVHLGKISKPIAQKVIVVFMLIKAQVEDFRINNAYLDDWDQIQAAYRHNSTDQILRERHYFRKQSLADQAKKLKDIEGHKLSALADLLHELDHRNID